MSTNSLSSQAHLGHSLRDHTASWRMYLNKLETLEGILCLFLDNMVRIEITGRIIATKYHNARRLSKPLLNDRKILKRKVKDVLEG